MQFDPEQFYHFYNIGNNKTKIFFCRENYLFFLRKVRIFMLPYCDIFSWCLMPNHFHFFINTYENLIDNVLNKKIGTMLSSYTRAINIQEGRTGSLFREHSKAKPLEIGRSTGSGTLTNEYPFICFNYIHQNPMEAGLVKKMEDWEFSSFKDYIGSRNGTLVNQSFAKELLDLPNDKKDFYEMSYKIIDDDNIKGIF
ncbi:MAG: transposase [Bacteroidetes bacterium]|nr:transposase [Bacteroidota bacterium]